MALPENQSGLRWYLVADTHAWLEVEGNFLAPGDEAPLPEGEPYLLGARSLLVAIEAP